MARTREPVSTQSLFSSLPPIYDKLNTKTTKAQAATVQDCLPCLTGAGNEPSRNEHGIPELLRGYHEDFLREAIESTPYQALDSQRPWLVYWNLTALSILGADIRQYDDR